MSDLKTVAFDASQWQLVPKAPTDEMAAAGRWKSHVEEIYTAMLAAAPTAAAQSAGQEAVALQHVAVSEGGKLRWMTGRKPRDCELYAMPDGGRAPKLYAAPVNGGERGHHPMAGNEASHCPRCKGSSVTICNENGCGYWEAGEDGERAADAPQVDNAPNMRSALQQALMALTGYLPGHRNAVTDAAIASAQAALSSPAKVGGDEREAFEREERYIVIKRKNLSSTKEQILRDVLHDNAISTVACVVVESDWPEYEPTWAAIEARVTGRTALSADGGLGRTIIDAYALPGGNPDIPVKIQRARQVTGPDLWKVTRGSECLNRDGHWEYEPLPSARDENFIDRCRWANAEAAIDAAIAAKAKGDAS
ncbi:hypothetical protein [Pandoraea pnomenusa]|uniref:hypothetical protein n=1 Tax=Pandoraea pnomenusa TaxID=93220 RepID=UPI00333EBF6B